MKSAVATIADVKREIAVLEAAIAKDPSIATLVGKKLASAVDLIKLKDSVTKDLSYAYTNGEKWWSVRYGNDEAEGCTKANKFPKIKEFILKTDAYARHYNNPDSMEKVVAWLADKFPVVGAIDA